MPYKISYNSNKMPYKNRALHNLETSHTELPLKNSRILQDSSPGWCCERAVGRCSRRSPDAETFVLVEVHHSDDLLNKRNCKSGNLSSFSCLYFHFFRKDKKKKSSVYINGRRRGREGGLGASCSRAGLSLSLFLSVWTSDWHKQFG